ncbi:DUF805 domain-containing protein [Sulfitobacter guttiformis]|uniref:Uncharacterized membrane protein YhaH (DUF805 family) n=1 Tax=Sulfitobacter guttiformis TaxID=74349 RepID=A0A420DR40_9RHOB|nr:DUF805 domain-containing protein [Sulfitobacter guttiformis]KIN74177.1 putative membrane protein [Sulfitobacter guttiformis KCTC 32187]RKE96791.1 uncharacterized membrane protein YhaH (DUF805 family) [Sulfitobacter guttiformis]
MNKEWYYALEGTSHGPVSQADFEQLVAAGTVRSDTLVWQEGMEDWLPYARAGSVGAAPLPPRAPMGEGQDPARSDANTFVGALKDGFARYVDFKTRSTRSQYWWFTLWSVIFSIATAIIDTTIGMGDTGPTGLLASLAMFLPSIAVAIRRLHDIGRTGWWILLIVIPLIGWIVLIVFYCTKTEEQPNQWGPVPQR